MSSTEKQAKEFSWLLDNFVSNTAEVHEAIAVSSDGLLLSASSGPDQTFVEQLAAITAGLSSLTRGAADMFEWEDVNQVIVEMTQGYLFVTTISDGSALAVMASNRCDMALVAYEMTLLVKRMGRALTPELIAHLKNTLTV